MPLARCRVTAILAQEAERVNLETQTPTSCLSGGSVAPMDDDLRLFVRY